MYNPIMKFLELKNKIGMNLSYVCGWVALYYVFVWPYFLSDGAYFALIFVFPIIEAVILVCFVITLIEIGFEHKIQNKFILENKFYNVIWLIGMFVSFLLTCIFVILFFYYLFMSR